MQSLVAGVAGWGAARWMGELGTRFVERAWLNEFGVSFVADVYGEMTDALVRAVRRVL